MRLRIPGSRQSKSPRRQPKRHKRTRKSLLLPRRRRTDKATALPTIAETATAIATETGQPTSEYKKVVELVRRGQTEAARAKREMIEANLRLVIKFAKKSSNRGLGLDFSDLVQDGNIGLMKAVSI